MRPKERADGSSPRDDRPATTDFAPATSANRPASMARSISLTTTPNGRSAMSGGRRTSERLSAIALVCSSTSARRLCPASPPSRSSTSSWQSPTRRSRQPTCHRWKRPAGCCGSASPTGSSTGCSKTRTGRVNLHVFSGGCPEIDRMLVFRDRPALRRRGPAPLRSGQARPRRPRLGVRPGLRRRQGRVISRHLGKPPARATIARADPEALRVDSEPVSRYRPDTHMNHPYYFRCPA